MAELFQMRNVKTDPEPIEANRITPETVTAISVWCGGVEVVEHDALRHEVTYVAINVPTVTGMKRAQEGDWVIRRPSGDFYPVKAERFEQLFEAVVDGN